MVLFTSRLLRLLFWTSNGVDVFNLGHEEFQKLLEIYLGLFKVNLIDINACYASILILHYNFEESEPQPRCHVTNSRSHIVTDYLKYFLELSLELIESPISYGI